jgi:hypothetical protein
VKNGIDRWRVGHLRGLSFARRRELPYDGAAVDYVLWRQPAGRRGKWNSLTRLSVTFLRQVVPSWGWFRCKFFCKMGTVAFSLLFGKYCPIMV